MSFIDVYTRVRGEGGVASKDQLFPSTLFEFPFFFWCDHLSKWPHLPVACPVATASFRASAPSLDLAVLGFLLPAYLLNVAPRLSLVFRGPHDLALAEWPALCPVLPNLDPQLL